MPRRKYGRLRKSCPPTPPEKCRQCKNGYPCPVHSPDEYELAMERLRKKKRGKKHKSPG